MFAYWLGAKSLARSIRIFLLILISIGLMACGEVEFSNPTEAVKQTDDSVGSDGSDDSVDPSDDGKGGDDSDDGADDGDDGSDDGADDGDDGSDDGADDGDDGSDDGADDGGDGSDDGAGDGDDGSDDSADDGDDGSDDGSAECDPSKNLIVNGDFEMVDERIGKINGRALDHLPPGTWDVYDSLPGLEGQDSWINKEHKSAGIEVQATETVVPAFSGDHLVELDSHGPDPNSTMYQDVYLKRGVYQIMFAYRARTDKPGDNMIKVKVGNRTLMVLNNHGDTAWSVKRAVFKVKKDGNYKVKFRALGLENTYGGLLDDVRLNRIDCSCESVFNSLRQFFERVRDHEYVTQQEKFLAVQELIYIGTKAFQCVIRNKERWIDWEEASCPTAD